MEKLFESLEHFKNLSAHDRKIFVDKCLLKNVRKDQLLFREGDLGTETYIVKKGIIRIFKKVSDDQIVTLAVLKKGTIFGELAVFEGIPRYADAVALTDVELFVLSKSSFDEISAAHPKTALAIVNVFMKFLGLYLRKTTDRVYGIYPPDIVDNDSGQQQPD